MKYKKLCSQIPGASCIVKSVFDKILRNRKEETLYIIL